MRHGKASVQSPHLRSPLGWPRRCWLHSTSRSIMPVDAMPQRSRARKGVAVFISWWIVSAALFAACSEPGSQEGSAPPPTTPQVKESAARERTASATGLPEPASTGTPEDALTGQSADSASEEMQLKACAMVAMEKCSVVLDDPKTHVACIKRNVSECAKTP